MSHKTRPPEGSPDELVWLRGYEAGCIDVRNDLHGEVKRLHDALEAVVDSLDNRMINLAPAVDVARVVLKQKEGD